VSFYSSSNEKKLFNYYQNNDFMHYDKIKLMFIDFFNEHQNTIKNIKSSEAFSKSYKDKLINAIICLYQKNDNQ
jgi:hypothetical protein